MRQRRIVIDSDIANELDDPFAIAHALLAPEVYRVEAITLAPFRREGLSAADSIRLSRELGQETLDAIGAQVPMIDGGEFLASGTEPSESEAVDYLLEASQEPLLILGIGACTNIASAILRDPEFQDRVEVWWLGGHSGELSAWEYNLNGDVHASRVLLESRVPLTVFPAWGVTSNLLVSLAALERDIEPTGRLGAFLTGLIREHQQDHFGYEKELWDVAVMAYGINPEWFRWTDLPRPTFDRELNWVAQPEAAPMRRITWLERNPILRDHFRRVATSGTR